MLYLQSCRICGNDTNDLELSVSFLMVGRIIHWHLVQIGLIMDWLTILQLKLSIIFWFLHSLIRFLHLFLFLYLYLRINHQDKVVYLAIFALFCIRLIFILLCFFCLLVLSLIIMMSILHVFLIKDKITRLLSFQRKS